MLDRLDALALAVVLDCRMDYAIGFGGGAATGFDSGSVETAAKSHTGGWSFIPPWLLRRIRRCERQRVDLDRANRETEALPGEAN